MAQPISIKSGQLWDLSERSGGIIAQAFGAGEQEQLLKKRTGVYRAVNGHISAICPL
jgi:hypothetical protein